MLKRLIKPLKQKTDRQLRGQSSERLAVSFLVSQGYGIVDTNVRYPAGEIDIIALDGDVLCFVEVRSTTSDAWGGPFASVTRRKQQRIIRAARWYLASMKAEPPFVRFDVLGILLTDPAHPQIDLIRGAFDAS